VKDARSMKKLYKIMKLPSWKWSQAVIRNGVEEKMEKEEP
jgi:hypothetical protein